MRRFDLFQSILKLTPELRQDWLANASPHERGVVLEQMACLYFSKDESTNLSQCDIPIGFSLKKPKRFDFGCKERKIAAECKNSTWINGVDAPPAKMTEWKAALYQLHLLPPDYKKLFIFGREHNGKESLAEHFIRLNQNLIPDDVMFYELDLINMKIRDVRSFIK